MTIKNESIIHYAAFVFQLVQINVPNLSLACKHALFRKARIRVTVIPKKAHK